MRRRRFLGLGAALLVAPLASPQSIGGPRRVGFVSPVRPGRRDAAFREGLRALGYVEGGNLRLELRFANGEHDRLRALAEELVRLDVEVLVAGSTIGARAARAATATIPIVFAGSGDPVAGGVVANLARPGGNVTGVSLAYGSGVPGKWPEMLKEMAPRVMHVAVLWSSSNAAAVAYVDETAAAARKLAIGLDLHHASNAAELDAALAAIAARRAQGIVVTPSPFAASSQDKLVRFAAQRRLPAMYFVEDFVEAGGLMSYGPSIAESYGRAAAYVDRILKGAKPGDLPVEQPTTLDLVVNRNAASALGLAVPQSIVVRARIVD